MGHLLIEVLGIEQQPVHIERYGFNFYGQFALQNLSVSFASLFVHRLGF